MARLVIELTNRCNLRCGHCFDERHAATGDLSLDIIEKILREARGCGIEHMAFTGGEPTLHRQFESIVRRVCESGYTFSLVSNGSTFPQVYSLLLAHRRWFQGVTLSLDGAREETHDQLRGAGSYRRVMRAASLCVFSELPFMLNMALTARNRHEVSETVELAAKLGSRGVRFGHLMPTPETAQRRLDLSPHERRAVEAEIWGLQKSSPIPIGMAPGYFYDALFFPCGPLTLQEFNLDYQGNLTLCCQLSGYAGAASGTDLIGNLHELSLAEACERFRQRVAIYLTDKQACVERGEVSELDRFPCWYCVKYMGKAAWLQNFPQHPWVHNQGSTRAGGKHDRTDAAGVSAP